MQRMIIKEAESDEKIDVHILPLTGDDFKSLKKDKRFGFDWSEEKDREVYKLVVKKQDEILGLISVETIREQFCIEICLLEVSKENVEKYKKYEYIAGCLMAYACRLSFQRGCHGWICLLPKTELKDYYSSRYGMKFTGLKNYSDTANSYALIQKYLEE